LDRQTRHQSVAVARFGERRERWLPLRACRLRLGGSSGQMERGGRKTGENAPLGRATWRRHWRLIRSARDRISPRGLRSDKRARTSTEPATSVPPPIQEAVSTHVAGIPFEGPRLPRSREVGTIEGPASAGLCSQIGLAHVELEAAPSALISDASTRRSPAPRHASARPSAHSSATTTRGRDTVPDRTCSTLGSAVRPRNP
jgi:hypothetical protein